MLGSGSSKMVLDKITILSFSAPKKVGELVEVGASFMPVTVMANCAVSVVVPFERVYVK